jgi:hypothetical protein
MVSKDDLLNDFEEVILSDWGDAVVIKRNQPSPNSLGELIDNFVIIPQNGNISIVGRLQPRLLINRSKREEQGVTIADERRLFLPYYADIERFDRIYYTSDYTSPGAPYLIVDDIKRHTLYMEVILKSEY